MKSSKILIVLLAISFTFGCENKTKLSTSQDASLPVQKLDFDTVEIEVDAELIDME